jgi:hypothetical protein
MEQLLINFEDFCKIVSEFQQFQVPAGERTKLWDTLAVKTSHILRCIAHPFSGRHRRHILQQQQATHQRPGSQFCFFFVMVMALLRALVILGTLSANSCHILVMNSIV